VAQTDIIEEQPEWTMSRASLYLPEALLAEMEKLAKDNERSFAAEARVAFREYIERHNGASS
jgi:metal-responsive CopG/Arc/MetJ family transcriptional regulator